MGRRLISATLRLSVGLVLLALAVRAPLAAQEAFETLLQAAEQGDPEAQYNLGEAYRKGEGVLKDDAEAARWYRMAAEQGHRYAQGSLGLAYRKGEGVLKDDAEAVRWFQMAAEQGSFHFLRLRVLIAGGDRDPAEAARVFQMVAEQGDPEAQFSLGTAYMEGAGVSQDLAEAARWFQMAAEQEDYRIAQGLVRSLQAAEQGDSEALAAAQFSLGRVYQNGVYQNEVGAVSQDLAEAVRWYRMAAEQGHERAQFSLGALYLAGEAGVLKDAAEAARWYRMAAEQGNEGAQFSLGALYANGEGLPQDIVLAHMWLNIAGANAYPHGLLRTRTASGKDAVEIRDDLEREMTRDEINRATELARTCINSNYQECGP